MQVIDLNSANYSAWEWRWQCFTTLLPSMPELLAQELHFLHSIAEVNVKNYQLWNYRRRLALMRGPAHASEASLLHSEWAHPSSRRHAKMTC